MFRSNVKGNSVSNSFMWIVGIFAVVICIAWIYNSLDPKSTITMDLINFDIESLQVRISDACNSRTYSAEYNPRTEEGNFTIHDSEICILSKSIQQCKNVVCNTGIRASIDLSGISEINIIKSEDETFTIS